MGSAYTPGLTVSPDTLVEKVRRLPIKGEVLVKAGDPVDHDTVVARAMLPGLLQTIKLGEKTGLEPKDALAIFRLKEGDPVEKGQLVAETKGIFGRFFKTEVHADFTGTIESISQVTGNVLIREPSRPVEMKAYVKGWIKDVLPEEGVVVETRGAMVQGIFGVGGERSGTVRVAVSGPNEVLDASHIQDTDTGKILIGGSGITLAALRRAEEVKVAGLVVGAVKDVDLIEFLGYDIGVAITGQEEISATLMATEGFGVLDMAARTFKLLATLDGKYASMNGATQIRAGVIRPEIIVPTDQMTEAGAPEHQPSILTIGTPIRVIREPYFGRLATVTGLPAQLMTVESGAEVRVLQAKLDNGQEVLVPRANVEIIATA
ncbi:MAG: hypothetical protein MH204_10160 [Fimbriimonadaceae bacterium]|nr:hypothetical protein [Fimbriimonadaceae bacterium]